MKYFVGQFFLTILLIFVFQSGIFSQELTPEQIFEKVDDCVVVTLSYDFRGNLSKQGSGVVIRDKGLIVTNCHVFIGCNKIEVKHKDQIIKHTDIIGLDLEKDILILKINENIFPSIQIGNSESLKVGQRVYAVGSPLGMENSLSEGLISGLRNMSDENKSYIQITASISPGSSGGAVINSKGELIGVSTKSLWFGQNLNFAIPINDILNFETGLHNFGNIKLPYNIPDPKNAKLHSILETSEGIILTFESNDKVIDIVNYYKEKMMQSGYSISDEGETLVSEKGGLINWTKEEKAVGLMLGYDKDKNITSLVISYK